MLTRCRQDVEDDPGQVAFRRWYLLNTRWLTICLHQFMRSDGWDLHNHEYDSATVIVRGFYYETIGCDRGVRYYRRRPWRWFSRDAEDFHRVRLPEGREGKVWTLFFQFHRAIPPSELGYLLADGSYVPQDEYDGAKGYRGRPIKLIGTLFPRVEQCA